MNSKREVGTNYFVISLSWFRLLSHSSFTAFTLQAKILFTLNMLTRLPQYSLSEVVFTEKVVLDQEVLKFETPLFFTNLVEEVHLETYNDTCHPYANKLASILQFNVNSIT